MTTAQVTKGTPCGEVQLRGAPEAIACALESMSKADAAKYLLGALRQCITYTPPAFFQRGGKAAARCAEINRICDAAIAAVETCERLQS